MEISNKLYFCTLGDSLQIKIEFPAKTEENLAALVSNFCPPKVSIHVLVSEKSGCGKMFNVGRANLQSRKRESKKRLFE